MPVSHGLAECFRGERDDAAFPSPEGIICILKKQSPAEDIYEILSLKLGELDGEPSLTLSRSSWARDVRKDGDDPLQPLLDDFLIDGPPVHLQPGPWRHVHVLLSTRSGTGLSVPFYTNVLAPLLDELGLIASSDRGHTAVAQLGSYHLVVTQDADSVKAFARELGERTRVGRDMAGDEDLVAEKNVEHTVVLLSGDGGVVDMLNGYATMIDDHMATSGLDLVSPSLPLIVMLPLGTGNALFSSLHKTVKTPAAASDLVRGLRTMLRGQPAPLPSFKAAFPDNSRIITYSETLEPASAVGNSTELSSSIPTLKEQTQRTSHLYGVVVASYGFHSQLVWESDTPEYRQHGAKRFHMVAQELLKESHAYRATIEVGVVSPDTEEGHINMRRLNRDQHSYVLATLVSNLEKTFCISPASKPLDGQLRLVHFGPVSGSKTMEIMTAAYDGGKHVDMRWGGKVHSPDGEEEEEVEGGVGYEEIVEVRITTHEEDPRWRKVCIDGTIVEIPAGGCMVVGTGTRRHLSVLVDKQILS